MNAFLIYAFSFLNTPYVYGGKTVLTGLDCSGLACEYLKGIGKLGEHENYNAQGLYDKFIKTGKRNALQPGALVFFGSSITTVDHVGILVDSELMISAAHGDHTTVNIEIAKQTGAFVKLRPYTYRKDFLTSISP